MVVSCEEVWREVSNYLDGEVEPGLRAAIQEHIQGCKHCTAVVDGVRNVIQLYGDERMLEVPFGFSQRLHRRLDENMPASRRNFLGWMVAAAAACLVADGKRPMDRWSDGRLARPTRLPASCRPGGDARRSTSNIRNFCPAADSIEEGARNRLLSVKRSSLYLCPASIRAYLPCS